ncbi:hypothetical protein PORY_001794 [Pneumocystis oryctolagi]|uniref:Uncharacterized protein n=1 Tax=Pneumocystis oryctolagi TaxID=42067 RepID=A0ACB7CAI6_9ASCO|nr:hypothetical protein PORY_001794 [Pneumocystis oryctolagi]
MKKKDTKLNKNEKKYKRLTKELNKLFCKYSISDAIELEDISVNHMIQLYEALYNTQFPFTNREDNSKKAQVKYLKLLLGTISHESLRIDLSHIDPVLVVEHDMESIINIVEVLVIIGNLQLLREKISMKKEKIYETTQEEDNSSISCHASGYEEETDNSQDNETSIYCPSKDSHNTSHTSNSLESSESISIISHINNRANKVFNKIHTLNRDLTHSTCNDKTSKKVSSKVCQNAKRSANSKPSKKAQNYNKNNNKASKLSYRSIGTQTSLPYFPETLTNCQGSPLSSSFDASYKSSSNIGPCSIKQMMQKVSLNPWGSESSENELSEYSLSSERDTSKTHPSKKAINAINFHSNFDDDFLKKKNKYDQLIKDNFKQKLSTLDENNRMYPYILHTLHKSPSFYLKKNVSQESSPNSDTTNIAFFKQKFHRGVLKVDSPYTLYLRKRRKNALNILHSQRSRLGQNLKKKRGLNHSKTENIKNIPYKKPYHTFLNDVSFYSPSELKSQTSFFSQYDENFTRDLEERLISAKKLYSNESCLHDDLISKMANHQI